MRNVSHEPRPTLFTEVFDAAVTQLDVATVIKASQAVSGEIEHGSLIKTLMSIAIEHAGAERGLLILMRGETLRIEAKAQFDQRTVKIELQQEAVTPALLPDSIVRTVIRTQQSVILDDASAPNPFSADQYLHKARARSVLCLPLMKQSSLVGLLYLENNLTPHVFTPARTAVLELLASQAAISLENARLYNDLLEREAKIRRLVDADIIGIYIWDIDGRIVDANEAFLRLLGYDRKDLILGRPRWRELTPAEWRDADDRSVAELKATGTASPYEKEYFQKSGNRVPVLVGAANFEEGRDEGVAFVVDLTDRKLADKAARESERRYREVETELAHANRVATMGQLSASIAHEVNQPITAVVTNADAAVRWLDAQPPDMGEVRQALARIVANGKRAGDVVTRVRALVTKTPARKDSVELNDSILEVLALTHGEAVKNNVSVQTQLSKALPVVEGDRVQLQQVILNLIVNAVEAMSDVDKRQRTLLIRTAIVPEGVLVEVQDSGPGLVPPSFEHVFDAFYTTKSSGLGMGLSICRSIIEAHGGKLWVSSGVPRGAIFHFTLSAHPRSSVFPSS